MGVIDVPDDRREQDEWLEQLRAKYDGPPPIPPDVAEDEARRDFGLEATARYADYVYHDGGEARLIPTTVVEFSNGASVQFFPKLAPAGQWER
jgi:hypothetical protein